MIDESGKVKFEPGSKWSKFDVVIQYAAFCEIYGSVLIGQRRLQEYYKTHPGKGLFHKLHYSDEAYICLIIRNNQGMWIHQNKEKEAKKERNSSSPQKSNTNRKRSRGNSKNQGIDTVSDTLLDATVSPRPLWTGFKTGSKISYLASGWSEEGELFFKTMENWIKSRTRDETEELHKIWLEHFGAHKTVQQHEHESLPEVGKSDDECVSVPEVDFDSDSEDDFKWSSVTGNITAGRSEGGCRDGMEGDADDLEMTPI